MLHALSQARFAAVVESSDAAIVTTDPDWVVETWNPAAERLFGYPATEILGRSLLALLPDKHRADAVRLAERVLAGDRVPAYETVRLRKDGTPVPVSVTLWPVRDPAGGVAGLAAIYTDLTERNQTEAALRSARAVAERGLARLRAVVTSMADGLVLADPTGNLIEWNPAAVRMHGYGSADEVRRHLGEFVGTFALSRPGGPQLPVSEWPMARVLRGETFADCELHVRRVDTRTDSVFSYSGSPVRGSDGAVELGVLTIHDVTEKRRLEEKLRQAQKMEAVGQLAGGVAHDFNNILTVVTGFGSLALDTLGPAYPARPMVEEVVRAGERAAGLTRQLLAFSRRAVVAPRALDVNALILDLDRMLRRLLGEDVDLACRLQPGLGTVRADPGQLEQVVVNLCVNARDAMPTGGKLTVETRDVYLGGKYAAAHPGAAPGRYVLLAVSDTGAGIPADALPHIFEPFFTTKGPGRGTGLGLATVHGVVKQAGGHVEVYSEVGHGTTFKVYLPRVEADPLTPPTRLAAPPRGTETVLVVEDQAEVRAVTAAVLRGAGYVVLEAADGERAAAVFAAHPGPVQLVVTDVVLPGASGREVAARLAAARPGLRVLYVSGYTDDAVVRHGVLADRVAFLQKPFHPAVLLHKVREVLDAPPGG